MKETVHAYRARLIATHKARSAAKIAQMRAALERADAELALWKYPTQNPVRAQIAQALKED